MSKRKNLFYWSLLIVWLALCSYVLLSFLLRPSDVKSEAGILFSLQMLVLTFPLGYLAALFGELLFTAIAQFDINFNPYFEASIIWLAMVVVGFFQWFIWLPKILRWIKSVWTKRNNPTKRKR